MKIVIEPTATILTVAGAPARLWSGTTDAGALCDVYVRLIGLRPGQDARAFDAELMVLHAAPSGSGALLEALADLVEATWGDATPKERGRILLARPTSALARAEVALAKARAAL